MDKRIKKQIERIITEGCSVVIDTTGNGGAGPMLLSPDELQTTLDSGEWDDAQYDALHEKQARSAFEELGLLDVYEDGTEWRQIEARCDEGPSPFTVTAWIWDF